MNGRGPVHICIAIRHCFVHRGNRLGGQRMTAPEEPDINLIMFATLLCVVCMMVALG